MKVHTLPRCTSCLAQYIERAENPRGLCRPCEAMHDRRQHTASSSKRIVDVGLELVRAGYDLTTAHEMAVAACPGLPKAVQDRAYDVLAAELERITRG